MANTCLRLIFCLFYCAVCGQQAPTPYGPTPSEAQLAWQETELYCLIHFGANTYNDREWGYGDEDPALVNPDGFDARQIAAVAKSAGAGGLIFVAKHHDGLCLWPTKTTDHHIGKSPWRQGKGDMVADLAYATRKENMRFGLYCSPWDCHDAHYGKPQYVATYAAQLRELYTRYGELFISWHDGANGGRGYYGGARESREIDRFTYYGWDTLWQITRTLQPNAVIFSDIGWDVRWVGNERGYAAETSWETYTPHGRIDPDKPAAGETRYEEGETGHRNGRFWMPAECDVPLRPGWFYHASQDGQAKTAEQLFELYIHSVGRGACLNLGLAPDKHGKIHGDDVGVLAEFGALLGDVFATNLATKAHLTASHTRPGNPSTFGVQNLIDSGRYSYWATPDSVQHPVLELSFDAPQTFNIIRLRENIRLGQRIEGAAIDIWENDQWREICRTTSIGACRLIRLPEYQSTSKIRLRITESPVCVALSDFGLFAEPLRLKAPQIARSKSGNISIQTTAPAYALRYTLDGTEPNAQSPAFTAPFPLDAGGMVRAAAFDDHGQSSEIATKKFGFSKEKWSILQASAEGSYGAAANAIDENSETYWSTWREDGQALPAPQALVVDMGTVQVVHGFNLVPQPAKWPGGLITDYAFFTSIDGVQWELAVQGEFGNIQTNRTEQTVPFERPVTARFFKFVAQKAEGSYISTGEIGVF